MRQRKKIRKLQNDEKFKKMIKGRVIKTVLENYGCVGCVEGMNFQSHCSVNILEAFYNDAEEMWDDNGDFIYNEEHRYALAPMKFECCSECLLKACCSETCEDAEKIFENVIKLEAERLAELMIDDINGDDYESQNEFSLLQNLKIKLERRMELQKEAKLFKKNRARTFSLAQKYGVDIKRADYIVGDDGGRAWLKNQFYWREMKETVIKLHKGEIK
jgi:hypothetical protein